MSEATDIEHILNAIEALYTATDASTREKADEWLQQWQRSVHAWQMADQLLFRNHSMESSYIAAQTMRSKVRNSFHELPEDAYNALRDSLIKHILTPNKNHVTLVQLCLALADLGHQVLQWQDFTGFVLKQFREPDKLHLLLEILTVLPEEVSSRHLRLGANRRQEITVDLLKNAAHVIELLEGCLLTNSSNQDLISKVFKCLSSWFEINAIPYSLIAHRKLLSVAFEIVCQVSIDNALHESVTNCICSAWLSVDGLQAEQKILALQLLENGKNLLTSYHLALAEEDTDKCLSYCRIFTECCETLLEEMVSTPGEGLGQFEVLECVITCAGHFEYEVCDMTFNVWYRLSELLYSRKSEQHNALFRPYMERLIMALSKHCQLESDTVAIPDSRTDFGEFRATVEELVQDVVFLVGSSNCFTHMFTLLQQQPTTATWESSEAALFIMAAVAKNMPADENVIVPQVINAILHLPDTTHLAVRYTSTRLVGELHHCIEKHPDILDKALNFLLANLQHEKLAAVAAHSLFCICTSSKQHLSTHFDGLVQIVQSVDSFNVSNSAALDLVKSTATILSNLNNDELVKGFKALCSAQVQHLSELSHQTNGSSDVSKSTNKADPCIWLDRLAAIFQHVKVTLHNGQVHPLQHVLQDLWPVLSEVLTRYQTDIAIIERCCRCIRFIVRCVGQSSAPLLSPLIQVMVSLYHTHHHSCYLYLGSILVDEYANDDSCSMVLLNMLQAFLPPTFEQLNTEKGFQNHPDTVDDLFRLCLRFVQHRPLEFMQSSMLRPVVSCAILASTVDHREANASVMKFLTSLFSTQESSDKLKNKGSVNKGKKNKEKSVAFSSDIKSGGDAAGGAGSGVEVQMKRALLQEVGGQFIDSVIHGCLDVLPTYMMPDVAEVVHNMIKLDHALVCQWLQAAISNIPSWSHNKPQAKPVKITESQMADFYRQVVSAPDDRQISHAFRDFIRLFK